MAAIKMSDMSDTSDMISKRARRKRFTLLASALPSTFVHFSATHRL